MRLLKICKSSIILLKTAGYTSQLENKMLLILERYFSQWTEIGMFIVPQLTTSHIVTHLFTFTLYSLILQETNSVSREPVKITKLEVCSDITEMCYVRSWQLQPKSDYQRTADRHQTSTTGVFLWGTAVLKIWFILLQGCGPLIIYTTRLACPWAHFWRQPSVSSKTNQCTADNKVCLCSYQTTDGEHALWQIWLPLTNCVPRRWSLRPSQVRLSTCTAHLLEKQGSWILRGAWTWSPSTQLRLVFRVTILVSPTKIIYM